MSKKVAVIMGSDSDFPVVKGCIKTLKSFGIETEVRVLSAHRTPAEAAAFADSARERGYGVLIAAAGKAAHLAGALAAHTTLPVIGIPVKSSTLDGLDALLSTLRLQAGDGTPDPGKERQIAGGGQRTMNIEKRGQLYEGKAKKVFETSDPNYLIVDYKDDATAFNGLKKGTIESKGIINNKVTNYLMKMLGEKGIPTHYVEEISDRETIVKRVSIVPLEVIVRNIAAGSLSKRLGIPEGTKLAHTVLEFCYKDDALGDPMVNEYHIYAMNLATPEEVKTISDYALRVNEILAEFLSHAKIELIDFKLEFGRLPDGTIILADEISPDTCRFWDSETGEKLDKDRFRRDLGNVEGAYKEILHRLLGL